MDSGATTPSGNPRSIFSLKDGRMPSYDTSQKSVVSFEYKCDIFLKKYGQTYANSLIFRVTVKYKIGHEHLHETMVLYTGRPS